MDSEFMSRYLQESPQESGPARAGEPVAEPQPPASPDLDDPGQDLGAQPVDDTTSVLQVGDLVDELVRNRKLPPEVTRRGLSTAEATTPVAPAAAGHPQEGTRPAAGPPAQRQQASPTQQVRTHQPPIGPPAARPRWSVAAERPPVTHRPGRWMQTPDAEHAAKWTAGTAGQFLRVDELVRPRRLPPEMGWRKVVYASTGHLVNLGAGPAERRLRDQIAAIGTNIPGNYQIGMVSVKGGIGKTRTAAGLGTVFGLYRTEPVLAIDANPTYGNLGRLIDPGTIASIREFMADSQMTAYPKARSYTGKNPQGLEVLAGNQNMANPLALSARLFNDTLARTRRFYQLALIDCGPDIEHPVMEGVFSSVDALVIVGSMNYDGAAAAEQTIDWLATRNAHELLRRSVVVLNDAYHCENKKFVTTVRNSLGPRVGDVKTIPWDAHLRDGAVFDFDALRRPTQLAYIELAAWLAQGFATAGAGAR